ncbi:metallophosphoesterase family protein [Brevibacterium litoralis]|uniref:metallophosphoesterase family protein n=1 Tax=Brevibacterium litoralis TaxID=3138935 RepID=UPI0032EABFB4
MNTADTAPALDAPGAAPAVVPVPATENEDFLVMVPRADSGAADAAEEPARVPYTDLSTAPFRPAEFTFALLSDRTGFARTGVFQRGIEVTNLFRPDFAVQIGDCIEGYTQDETEIRRQWDDFDAITDELDVPLFRVPGNHDVSNPTMQAEWLRRHGALHYAFTYWNVLFVVLDTQDPPKTPAEMGISEEDLAKLLGDMRAGLDGDARAYLAENGHGEQMDGPMPAAFGEEQIAFFERVVAENPDVSHTVVLMHMPVWQDRENAAYLRFSAALGERDFTMFAGHCHNYRRGVIDGRDHIRLSSTGDGWTTADPEGSCDHITLVQMTGAGPRIANVVLDGVLGVDGGTYSGKGHLDEPLTYED